MRADREAGIDGIMENDGNRAAGFEFLAGVAGVHGELIAVPHEANANGAVNG